MFGFFTKKTPHMSGTELAEEGLRQIAIAIQKKAISIERGRVSDDIYAHGDRPLGTPRLTYVMFSPSVENQVIARCVIMLDRVEGNTPVWQIDWAVLKAYRSQGYGLSIVAKSLMEFTSGMKGKTQGYAIEAVVDEENEASLKIARKALGNEKRILKDSAGHYVHNFLRPYI